MILLADKIITGEKIIAHGALKIEGEKIAWVERRAAVPNAAGEEILDFGKVTLIPGFIDTHLHGGNGFDVSSGEKKDLGSLAEALAKEGVTSFFATTGADSNKRLCRALESISAYMEEENYAAAALAVSGGNVRSEVVGIHMEGPYISQEYRGAQEPTGIRCFQRKEWEQFLQAGRGKIREMTFAPEIEGGMELLYEMVKHNIVPSIGHSGATFMQVKQAIANGARQATHAFHGMSGMHHREPGVVGALLHFKEELVAEMAAFDGIGITKEVWKIFYEAKGYKNMMLTTDAVRLKGLPDGEYDCNGRMMLKRGIEIFTKDGIAAGSSLDLLQSIRNIMEVTGASLEEIVFMGCVKPACQFGIYERKGSLAVGKDADLTILDEQLNVKEVFCRGRQVFGGSDKN